MNIELNDLIIDLEAKISTNSTTKDLLIEETFVLWYVLVEGTYCENFTEKELEKMLSRNVGIYRQCFSEDPDFNFIIGWMTSIAFWYIDPEFREDDGVGLLKKAYKRNPENNLFKWALRKELNLPIEEVKVLEIDLALRFDRLYNHGTLLKEYFLDLIGALPSRP